MKSVVSHQMVQLSTVLQVLFWIYVQFKIWESILCWLHIFSPQKILHFIINDCNWHNFLTAEMTPVCYCNKKKKIHCLKLEFLKCSLIKVIVVLKLETFIYSFIIHAFHIHLVMLFYIVILYNLIYSTGILYSISLGAVQQESNITLYLSFITRNKIITFLVYTLVNLGMYF